VELALATSSSDLVNGSATTTGPKISSGAILISGFTSFTTVGSTG